jgi:hypothetical protein
MSTTGVATAATTKVTIARIFLASMLKLCWIIGLWCRLDLCFAVTGLEIGNCGLSGLKK